MATTTPGIDVSRWQGDIDWAQVAAAGYRFAIIRATVGDYYVDPLFEANWVGARNVGLLVSAYHALAPEISVDVQIAKFLETLGDRKPDLPLVLDIELSRELTVDEITASVLGCLQKTEERHGRRPIVYTAQWFWNPNVALSSAWSGYDLWVASYGVSEPLMPSGWSQWRFWQYSDKGSVPGIQANVDLDWFAGTYDELLAYAGSAPQPRPRAGLAAHVTADSLNVRNGPGVNYADLGDVPTGAAVLIASVGGDDAWGQIGPDRWIALVRQGDYYAELAPVSEPAPGLQAQVAVAALNVRSSPSTDAEVVEILHAGDVVSVIGLDGKDAWVELEPGKWIAFAFRGERFMEVG